MPKTILFLAANPVDTKRLRLDKEFREIEATLNRARQREQFTLKALFAVRLNDIKVAMLELNPQIVHFAGHAEEEKGLVFEDESGHSKLIDQEALANLFELFAGNLECVVLNGCYTQVQAKAIAQHISYVIGMDKAIGDKAAIEFAVGFYSALGAGKSYEFACRFGCVAISENLTPQLLKREGMPLLEKDIELDQQIKELKSEIELDQHFLEVAKSLKSGQLTFFIGSGINLIRTANDLPPNDKDIAKQLIDFINLSNYQENDSLKKLIGTPCELCPFPKSSCPIINNNDQIQHQQQEFIESKLIIRCIAQHIKSQNFDEQLMNVLAHYYKPNPLQNFLANIVSKYLKSTPPLIITTTYDCGLEMAFEAQTENDNIDILYHPRPKESNTSEILKYISYKKENGKYQNNPPIVEIKAEQNNKDDIITTIEEHWDSKYKDELVRFKCPLILKLYGGLLYSIDSPEEKDSFFIPETYHENYLRLSNNKQSNINKILPTKLIRHLKNSKILFIGYTANDPDLISILHYWFPDRFKGQPPRSSEDKMKGWLIHQSDTGKLYDESYWKNNWRIETFQFSWEKYVNQLEEFLNDYLK